MFAVIKIMQKNACVIRSIYARNFSISATTRLKEIHETRDEKVLTLEAVSIPSPREPYLFMSTSSGICPICSTGLDVKHTDVLILSQFVRSDGCMLPRRITGLCRKQQKRIGKMVQMAHKAGLMPNLQPPGSKMDPSRRSKWKKYNTYYDEDTIKFWDREQGASIPKVASQY